MSIAPLTFSGVSAYSADFQTILQRVVNIASFPLTQLQNEQMDVASKKQLTNELKSSVKLFGDKLDALKEIAATRAVRATSSNSTKLGIDSVNTGTLTSYSITEVTSIASAASETSAISYANSATTQVSASGNLRLSFGSTDYDFSLASDKNNLIGLRDKINTLNAGVTASILTVDGTTNYLSISANSSGAKTLTLKEDPGGADTDFLTTANQGSNLQFKLNGVPVTRTSNQVNDLVPGVSFSLKQTTGVGETLTIGLSSDRDTLSSAISGFVDAYNALQDKISAQVGAAAGLLSGDLLVREAQDILRKSASFGLSEGTVKSFSDLGVSFDQSGVISFDFTVFNALSGEQIDDSFDFFAGETGLGALSASTDAFSDEVTGLAQLQIEQFDRTDLRIEDQILNLQERILILQQSYQAKLQAADSLLAGFEAQQRIIGASIDSLNLMLYGKREG